MSYPELTFVICKLALENVTENNVSDKTNRNLFDFCLCYFEMLSFYLQISSHPRIITRKKKIFLFTGDTVWISRKI